MHSAGTHFLDRCSYNVADFSAVLRSTAGHVRLNTINKASDLGLVHLNRGTRVPECQTRHQNRISDVQETSPFCVVVKKTRVLDVIQLQVPLSGPGKHEPT